MAGEEIIANMIRPGDECGNEHQKFDTVPKEHQELSKLINFSWIIFSTYNVLSILIIVILIFIYNIGNASVHGSYWLIIAYVISEYVISAIALFKPWKYVVVPEKARTSDFWPSLSHPGCMK